MKPRIIEYEEVDSTNEAAKRLVRDGDNEIYGTVITAKRQTAGKGRRGKSFFSPGGDSIYASFILPPPENMAEQQITTLAGAAVCEAIKIILQQCKGGNLPPENMPTIRGVNDVLLDGRKVCGILTEGIPGVVIIGVGININLDENDFPEELREIAGSLRLSAEERERLFEILSEVIFDCSGRQDAAPTF